MSAESHEISRTGHLYTSPPTKGYQGSTGNGSCSVIVLFTVLAIVVITGCDPADAHLYHEAIPYPELPAEEIDAMSLEFVQEFGELEGDGLVFGHIADLAVSSDGILAVVDAIGCRVWLINTETAEGHAIGGCGQGPGEFGAPWLAAFVGDTLIVYDYDGHLLKRLTTGGHELGRAPLPLMSLGTYTLSALYQGTNGEVIGGLNLLPSGIMPQHHQIARFRVDSGTVSGMGLVVPPAAQITEGLSVRYSSLCVSERKDGLRTVVAVNPWAPQATMLEAEELEPILSVKLPVAWATARLNATGELERVGLGPAAACGGHHALIGYRRQRMGTGPVAEVLRATMVLVDLEGEEFSIIGDASPPEPGSVLFMTPSAAIGERFFLFTNAFFGHPVVREYRLVRRGGQQ
jgi:hypothetical protein